MWPDVMPDLKAWRAELESQEWSDGGAVLKRFPKAIQTQEYTYRFQLNEGRYAVDTLIRFEAQVALVVKLTKVFSETPVLCGFEC